jgi:hypothetical protein
MNIEIVDKLKTAVEAYATEYGLTGLQISSRYNRYTDMVTLRTNPVSYPNAQYAGCYCLYDAMDVLLYVGKASLGSTMGIRLEDHLAKINEAKNVRKGKAWVRDVRWVLTVRVKHAKEAPSLEEHLITKLKPLHNSIKGVIADEDRVTPANPWTDPLSWEN